MDLNLRSVRTGGGLRFAADELSVIDATVEAPLPGEYHLSPCRPNPFNAMTMVSYGLPVAAWVNIHVFDITGRLVTTLVDAEIRAGSYTVVWDARSFTSGVYIFRMEAGGFRIAHKVMLIR